MQTRATTPRRAKTKRQHQQSKSSSDRRSNQLIQFIRKSMVAIWHSEVWRSLQFCFRRPSYTSKVFCIGFNKTGTTSLGEALKELGYLHSTYTDKTWLDYYQNNKIVKLLEHTAKLDSVDDLPWLKEDMIPILDKVFPQSKFIYLERDEASWKRSIYHWSYQRTGQYPDVEQKLREFRAHRMFVMDYFRDRPNDQFIVLNIADPEGFEKLGKFLGKPTPRKAFRHHNATVIQR